MHKRTCGHRSKYKELLKQQTLVGLDVDNDLYSLGLHLHLEHGCKNPNDFDKYFRFAILEVTSPSNLSVKEYMWMHRLNTFQPNGINVDNPFGLPYLGQK